MVRQADGLDRIFCGIAGDSYFWKTGGITGLAKVSDR
jgi:hypothetical protein